MNAKVNPTPAVANKDGIIDLDLSVIQKKKFRFNKDDSCIIELNTSDMRILSRISEAYPKLQALQDKASKIMEGIDTENIETEEQAMDTAHTMAERLTAVDNEMREYVDYIFDAPVSNATARDGSMYDPINGSWRYEHILNFLMGLYEKNLQSEFGKMEKQLKSHTAKYSKGK